MKKLYLFIAVLVSASCSSNNTQYLLNSNQLNNEGIATVKNSEDSLLAIRYVKLPEYLDTKNIIYLKNNTIVNAKGTWFIPFETNFKNTLTAYLSNQLDQFVANYPIYDKANYIIDIEIQSMIADENSHALKFTATWQLTDTQSKKIKSYQSTKSIAISEITASEIVEATNKATLQLASDISQRINGL